MNISPQDLSTIIHQPLIPWWLIAGIALALVIIGSHRVVTVKRNTEATYDEKVSSQQAAHLSVSVAVIVVMLNTVATMIAAML